MEKSLPPAEAEAADDDGSCISPPFNCLTDDVVLEILNKVMDLKTLCVCQVVSKRFYAIAHQVDAICYTTPFCTVSDSLKCKSFLKKFVRVKSLCIRCPSPSITYNNDDDVLYKWKVKMGKNGIDSFVFVSPTSVYDKNNGLLYCFCDEDNDPELVLIYCFYDGCMSIAWLKDIAIDFPLLEKISITDSDNWDMVSLNGREKLEELRNCVDVYGVFPRKTRCYVPLLELPVSRYVMKGVTLFLADCKDVSTDGTYDSFINDEIDFKHDKIEAAAYHEAMNEIFKKHRGAFMRVDSMYP